VTSNHPETFIYLFFKEQCSLRNIDLNGNTVLHLAARSNSINIARLLRHMYRDATIETEDTNLEVEHSPIKM
jgi:ankyrin repeat protein